MNNRIYLIATILSLLFFSACEDVYDHVAAPPQSYEQDAEQSIDGFTFTLGSGLSSPVVLTSAMIESGTVFEAINTTATPELAEGATVSFALEASDSEDFENVIELISESNDNKASILAADLDAVVKELYGKRPEVRDLYLRAKYYIVDGTTSSLMPTPAVFGPVKVTPVGSLIENEYYLVGEHNGWAIDNLEDFQFNHSGKDVYEDPYFSILVENLGKFKIVPKSSKEAASWDGVFGTSDASALEGELSTDGGDFIVEEPGWVKITLNMMEYTYTLEIIGEMNLTLYVPGGHQGWAPDVAPTLYSRNFDFKYDGFVYFPDGNTEFKFTAKPSWEGPNYGNSGTAGELSDDGGAGNLVMPEPGFYKLDVDLSGAPYKYTALKTTWGIIGDAVGSWDNDVAMTFNPDTHLWTATTDLVEGKEMKFRANGKWDINFGGNLNNLGYGADNILVTEAGTYLITLDLTDSKQYKATLVKQ